MSVAYSLELLHISDQEGASNAFADAPRLSAVVNALREQDLFDDGLADNTLFLSSGDAYIPGLFLSASTAVFGAAGVGDILIQNAIGIQAIGFGNHEFDLGTPFVRGLINGTTSVNATGTNYPYLSCNLNFGPDTNLVGLVQPPYQPPLPKSITSSIVFTVGGEKIGVVGATTPTLRTISSPGSVIANPQPFAGSPNSTQLDALAAIIQTEVNSLIAANAGMNKVILLAHMQILSIELALATRLTNVDIIVAGGSNTRLFDGNDRVRAGDSNQGTYPAFVTNAGNTTTAVVNTDGSYKYVGRLVIGFDAAGNLLSNTYNMTVSGAYATDDQGVTLLNSTGSAIVDPEVRRITELLAAAVFAQESEFPGFSSVFLNGQRGATNDTILTDGVRTQETNLGDLTADANLWYARLVDPNVVVSIKNGGGIRASIGEVVVPANSTSFLRLPTSAVVAANGTVIKPSNAVSRNDIATALAFNNGLTLVTVTRTELRSILEYGIGLYPVTAGRAIQVAGVRFSFDISLPAGSRIRNLWITSTPSPIRIVTNGAIIGNVNETFRVVTLDFLTTGGDGYTFPAVGLQNLTSAGLPSGNSTFAPAGSEQDAFAEFLFAFHRTNATAYSQADVDRSGDLRIQDLRFRSEAGPPTRAPTRAPTNPTRAPVKAPTTAPVSDAPVTVAPSIAPVSPSCGLFGFSLFCPRTQCGLFGRILGLCD